MCLYICSLGIHELHCLYHHVNLFPLSVFFLSFVCTFLFVCASVTECISMYMSIHLYVCLLILCIYMCGRPCGSV